MAEECATARSRHSLIWNYCPMIERAQSSASANPKGDAEEFVPRASARPSWIVIVASLIGAAGFLYPFLLPTIAQGDDTVAHASEAPLMLAVVTALCLLAIVVDLDAAGAGTSSKTVALLGVLVSFDAALRLAPTLLGASPIFVLIVMAGAVYGSSFGFQMGALTLLVSAFLTGGLGPWLPYQMLGAGWVGLTAGWLPKPSSARARLIWIAGFAAVWGFAYGALLNLWFWPFSAPGIGADAGLYWSPGLSAAGALHRYLRFYLVTSFGYDLARAAGNVALTLLLGGPLLLVLERFKAKFEWRPWRIAQLEELPR
jgi:energy-coupling factor transport system substrate-specific component